MAKACAICAKTSVIAGRRKLLRGHYNPTTKVRKYPNLQWLHISPEIATKQGRVNAKRILACAKCKKALAKHTRENR